MQVRATSCWVTSVLLAVVLVGCGSEDKDEDKKDSGAKVDSGAKNKKSDNGDAGGEDIKESDGQKDAATAAKDSGSGERVCGNKVVEPPEECDDGDLDNTNGCNALCEFNCKEDTDCDDQNPCNGKETCEKNQCEQGTRLDEGASCGANKSCWKDICTEDICGDKVKRGEEQCDDGNTDATDGCTPDCKFTCEANSDCSGAVKECTGSLTCNVEHMCIGTPIADKSGCTGGWCISGECVPTGCGDDIKVEPEECDEGANNGKAGSGCTVACKEVKCGNGTLESGEECDDGNVARLDGCDPICKVEVAHRWTMMHIIKGAAPDFCVHQSNRFGDAYSGAEQTVDMMGTPIAINVLEMANERINERVATGEANTIVHLYDSADTSLQTSDSDIQIGIYDAMPAKKWVNGPPIDFPFYVLPEALEKNRLPKVPIVAEQAGGGKVVSKAASHIVGQGPTGKFEMYDAMLRYTYDVSKLSAPQAHNRFPFSDQVRIPEAMGAGSGDPYNPSGIMCGAMTTASQQARLIDSDLAQMCCKTDGTQYRACSNGKTPPNCDTYADVLKGGCTTVCFDAAAAATGTMARPTCKPGCGLAIIVPIEADVDTDKDGTNDAYSSVIAFEGKRVRIAGVAEE
jgi:cysteine-rich repeat protein